MRAVQATAKPLGYKAALPPRQVIVEEPLSERRLSFLLAAYIFLLPVQIPVGQSRLGLSDPFIILYAILNVGRLRIRSRRWSVFHWALLFVFLTGTLVTALREAHLSFYAAINKDAGLLLLFLTYAAITSAAESWKKIRAMLRIYVIACALHAAFASGLFLILKVTGHNYIPWLNYANTRVSGMLVDPNAFGGLIAVALVIHAATFFGGSPLIRGIRGYATLMTLTLAIVLTLSRSAWLGCGVSLLLISAFRPRILLGFASAAALASILFVALIGPQRTDGILALADRPATAYQRLEQIQEALPMFASNPFVGSGLASFKEAHGWIIHDTTVWMLTEFGVLGFLVYAGLVLWYFYVAFVAHSRGSPPQRAVILGLVCAHVCMLGVSLGIEAFYQRHWWFVMALLASSYALITEDNALS